MFWALAVLLGAAVALFIHEASHYAVAKLRGAEIVAFKPYPHVHNGRLYLGRVSYYTSAPFRPTRWVHGSPAVASTVMALLWALGALWCPYLWVLAAWAVVDHLWWWRGFYGLLSDSEELPLLDGHKFRHFNS